jgi:hypothetical protein
MQEFKSATSKIDSVGGQTEFCWHEQLDADSLGDRGEILLFGNAGEVDCTDYYVNSREGGSEGGSVIFVDICEFRALRNPFWVGSLGILLIDEWGYYADTTWKDLLSE